MFGNVIELHVGFEAECSMNGVLQRLLDVIGRYAEVINVHGGYWGQEDGFVRFGLRDLKAERAFVAQWLNALVQVAYAEFEDDHQNRHYRRACADRAAAV